MPSYCILFFSSTFAFRRLCYAVFEYVPVLDSSDMDMNDWTHIATDIEKFYDDWDAFIVLHGTDTMAYTASALSYMLQGACLHYCQCLAMLVMAWFVCLPPLVPFHHHHHHRRRRFY